MPRIVKGKAFHLRLEDDLKQEVDAMCEGTGVEAAPLIRALLKATLRFYKEEGYLHLPLVVYPANSAAHLKAAERHGKFRDDPPRQRRRRERPSGPTTTQPPRQSAA